MGSNGHLTTIGDNYFKQFEPVRISSHSCTDFMFIGEKGFIWCKCQQQKQ